MTTLDREGRFPVRMRRSTIEALDPFAEKLGEHPDDVIDRFIAHMKTCPILHPPKRGRRRAEYTVAAGNGSPLAQARELRETAVLETERPE